MRHYIIAITIVCCGALPVLSAAERGLAGDGSQPAAGKAGDGHRAALVERFDQDGDGRLSAEEREAAQAALGQRRAKGRGRLAELKKRFDKDGDGRLSEEERAAAREFAWQKVEERLEGMKVEHPERYAKIDADGNGTVTREEARAAKEALLARLIERRPELVARFDRDGNGTLEGVEGWVALRWARQQRRQRGGAGGSGTGSSLR